MISSLWKSLDILIFENIRFVPKFERGHPERERFTTLGLGTLFNGPRCILLTGYQRVTDRHTDGRMDIFTRATSALEVVSFKRNSLYKCTFYLLIYLLTDGFVVTVTASRLGRRAIKRNEIFPFFLAKHSLKFE